MELYGSLVLLLLSSSSLSSSFFFFFFLFSSFFFLLHSSYSTYSSCEVTFVLPSYYCTSFLFTISFSISLLSIILFISLTIFNSCHSKLLNAHPISSSHFLASLLMCFFHPSFIHFFLSSTLCTV
jgi:hypothetical protein